MNRTETAMLLTLCAAFDARTIGEADVKAWADVLASVPFVDAEQAVKNHYGSTDDFIKPSHIKAEVKRIRRDRLDHADASFVPSPVEESFEEYQRALLEHRRAIGDGAEPPEPAELTRPVPARALTTVFRDVVPRHGGAA